MKLRPDRFAPAILGAVVLLLHGSSLRKPLFADDYLFFDRVRYRSLADAIAMPDALGNFWRPLTRQVYFWIVAHRFAESAVVLHAVNLLSLLAILLLFFFLVRRWAGSYAAWVGALGVALSCAWDVPILWGSGTQDLFAILLALVALHLSDRGHHVAGALAYGIGLLCKEVVLLLPVLVVLLEAPRRRLRALAPYVLVVVAWAIPWSSRMRASPNAPGMPGWSDALAALAHLPQVVLGLETGPLAPFDPARALAACACAALSVSALFIARKANGRGARADSATLGIAWIAIGVLPVVAVASIWSAYYYAFALCGVGLLAGVLLRSRPWQAAAGVVLVMLAGATLARQRESIGVPVGAWTGRSHIDASYVLRSERIGKTMLESLRRAVPRPSPRSTFFFSGVPGSISWQVGDGPLVRWAYRDSSLRSYWLSQITDERVDRGRIYLFRAQGDTVFDVGDDRGLTFGTAARALLQGDREVARGALRYHLGRWPDDSYARSVLGWIAAAEGDVALRDAMMGAVGFVPDTAGANAAFETARRLIAARDTLGARQALGNVLRSNPFDARAHGAFADLALGDPRLRAHLLVESYAVIALAPQDPASWRRWAFVQAYFGEVEGGLSSLARYRQLAPAIARDDRAAAWLEGELERRLPHAPGGGQLVLD